MREKDPNERLLEDYRRDLQRREKVKHKPSFQSFRYDSPKNNRKKQIDKFLKSMRMINNIIELAATLGEEEKNKVAKELESTIENIKRGLDRLK